MAPPEASVNSDRAGRRSTENRQFGGEFSPMTPHAPRRLEACAPPIRQRGPSKRRPGARKTAPLSQPPTSTSLRGTHARIERAMSACKFDLIARRLMKYPGPVFDDLPDARDGLTRKERVVLWVLSQAERERKGRAVRSAMLYGRVIEHIDMSIAEFMRIATRLSELPTPLTARSQQRRFLLDE